MNGVVVGHIPWSSENGFDLTPHLHAGENEIGVEAVGTLRNMLGPLHRRWGREPGTSWSSFRTEGAAYTPEYVLELYGLFEQVRFGGGERVEHSRSGSSATRLVICTFDGATDDLFFVHLGRQPD